jgi:hypothetical protein
MPWGSMSIHIGVVLVFELDGWHVHSTSGFYVLVRMFEYFWS